MQQHKMFSLLHFTHSRGKGKNQQDTLRLGWDWWTKAFRA